MKDLSLATRPSPRPKAVSRQQLDPALPPVLFVSARVGIWQGSARPGDTGLTAVDGVNAFVVFEVPGLPDLRSVHVQGVLASVGKGTPEGALGELFAGLLAELQRLNARFGLTLRYLHAPPHSGFRLFLIGRCFGRDQNEAGEAVPYLRELIRRAWPEVFRLREVRDAEQARHIVAAEGMRSLVEVLKPEAALTPLYDRATCGFDHYYQCSGFSGRDVPFNEVCELWLRLAGGRAMAYDVAVVPAQPLTDVERWEVTQWIERSRYWESGAHKVVTAAGPFRQPLETTAERDPAAALCRVGLEQILKDLGDPRSTPLLYGVRVLWDSPEPPWQLALALCERLRGATAGDPHGNPQLVAVTANDPHFERAMTAVRNVSISPAVHGEVWGRPDRQETIRRLHRMATPRELGSFFRGPLPTRDRTGGFEVDVPDVRTQATLRELVPPRGAWWKLDTAAGLSCPIGWALPSPGAPDECEPPVFHFSLDDGAPHALLAGRTGMGKSSLFHALVLGLGARYSPDELHLYLVDLKDGGVEFQHYEHLPHARVVGMGAHPEFGVAVLEELDRELTRRGALFSRHRVKDLAEYRSRVGALPRVLLIVDEFQVLFDPSASGVARRAAAALDRLATRGRVYGVHFLLATQSLSAGAVETLSTSTKNQCALRISLPLNGVSDAARILLRDPEDIASITRAGEALVSDMRRPANARIQIAYAPSDAAFSEIRQEVLRWVEERFATLPPERQRRPTVFDGQFRRLASAGPPPTLDDLLPARDRWWSSTRVDELRAPIGWVLPAGVIARAEGLSAKHAVPWDFVLDDKTVHGLVVGRTGGGKSSLFHTLLLSLAARYSPAELLFYLIDLKVGGVEFNDYRDLPHARVVSLASDREFALNVLKELRREIVRRSELFASRGVRSIVEYRERGHALPRILMLVDEFQALGEKTVGAQAALRDLEHLAAQGRVYGVHLLLATQSLRSVDNVLSVSGRNHFGLRICLPVNDPAEARHVLIGAADHVGELRENGEMIYEAANAPSPGFAVVRVGYGASPADYQAIRSRVRAELTARRAALPIAPPPPRVFDGRTSPRCEDAADLAVLEVRDATAPPRRAAVCLGEALDIDPRSTRYELPRETGRNLLLCGPEEEAALAICLPAVFGFVATQPACDCRVAVVAAAERARPFHVLSEMFPDAVSISPASDPKGPFAAWCEEIDARRGDPRRERSPWLLVLFGLTGVRCLDSTGRSSPERTALVRVLTEGPETGLHVLAWSQQAQLLDTAFGESGMARRFGGIVGLSPADLKRLAPDVAAAGIDLPPGFALLVESSTGSSEKFRVYAEATRWLRRVAASRPAEQRPKPPPPPEPERRPPAPQPPPPTSLRDLVDPTTWSGQSGAGLRATVGWPLPSAAATGPRQADGPWELTLDDHTAHCLIVGRQRFEFFRTLVTSLVARYSPSELGLYLIDLSFSGAGFLDFESLPHAHLVTRASTRAFGLNVLLGLHREIQRRRDAFTERRCGSYSEFRESGGAMPRLLVVVDEFHALTRASAPSALTPLPELDFILHHGGLFGVHLVLATQGARSVEQALSERARGALRLRVASSLEGAEEARRLFTKGAELVAQLTDPRHLIYEAGGAAGPRYGLARLADPSDTDGRPSLWSQVIARGRQAVGGLALPRPRVFDGRTPPRASEARDLDALVSDAPAPAGRPAMYLGESPRPDEESLPFLLRREVARNLLVCGADEEAARAVCLPAIFGVLASGQRSCATILALGGADSSQAECFGVLAALFPGGAEVVRGAEVGDALRTLHRELDARLAGTSEDDRSRLLVVFGLHSSRALLAPLDRDSPERDLLVRLVKEGPDVGLHTLVWVRQYPSLDASFGKHCAELDFTGVVALSPAEASHVLPSTVEAGEELGQGFALFVDRAGEQPAGSFRLYREAREWMEGLRSARPGGLRAPQEVHRVDDRAPEAPLTLQDLLPAPKLWWKEQSIGGLRAPIGWRLPPTDAAPSSRGNSLPLDFVLDDRTVHGLVAGRTGGGKSSLFHTLLLSLAARYSPAELLFYLIDLKAGGVEFSDYRDLPHARVVSLASDREFALNVIKGLRREIVRRGEMFKEHGVRNIAEYREDGHALPRILMLIDEFQALGEKTAQGQATAVQDLDYIGSQGRVYGVHLLLATQSLESTEQVLSERARTNFSLRICLPVNDPADARRVLKKAADEIGSISRSGEMIYEDLGGASLTGHAAARIAFGTDEKHYDAVRKTVRSECQTLRASLPMPLPPPRVFDGTSLPRCRDADLPGLLAPGAAVPRVPSIYVGESLELEARSLKFRLNREGARNVLVSGPHEDLARSICLASAFGFVAPIRARAPRVTIVTSGASDSGQREHFAILPRLFPDVVEWRGAADVGPTLTAWCNELDARQQDTSGIEKAPWLLVLFGLHGVRSLSDVSGRPGPEKQAFQRLISEGPMLGLHVLVWVRQYQVFTAAFPESRWPREFAGMVALTVADASKMALGNGLPLAELQAGFAALTDHSGDGTPEKFRVYRDTHEWLASLEGSTT